MASRGNTIATRHLMAYGYLSPINSGVRFFG